MNTPMRILIIDSHEIVRYGLRSCLKEVPDMLVVGEASNGMETISTCVGLHPDLILLDLALVDMDGLQILSRIRQHCPQVLVMILTNDDSKETVLESLRSGAVGLLKKDVTIDDLLYALRSARQGRTTLHQAVLQQLADADAQSAPSFRVTNRERDVLGLMVEGLMNKEIAVSLCISLATTKAHIRNLFAKLNVHNRARAVYLAQKYHLTGVRGVFPKRYPTIDPPTASPTRPT